MNSIEAAIRKHAEDCVKARDNGLAPLMVALLDSGVPAQNILLVEQRNPDGLSVTFRVDTTSVSPEELDLNSRFRKVYLAVERLAKYVSDSHPNGVMPSELHFAIEDVCKAIKL